MSPQEPSQVVAAGDPSRAGRLVRRAAPVLWTASVLLVLTTLAIAVASWSRLPSDYRDPGQFTLLPLGITISSLGAIICVRQPRNRIGWLVLAIGFFSALESCALYYAAASLFGHVAWLPGGAWALWIGQWAWAPEFILLPSLLPLVFPDGLLPSARWRPVVWLDLLLVASAVAGAALLPPTFKVQAGYTAENPLRLRVPISDAVLRTGTSLTLVGFAAAFILGAASLVVRRHRASAVERQQIKWFAFAVALLVVLQGPQVIVTAVTQQDSPGWVNLLTNIAFNAVPIAIGLAVLRYRLYDIDIVISRGLLYGSLALFITGLYVAIVVGLGSAIGTGGKPDLVLSIVATATVAVAFQPARERLQRIANRVVYGRRSTPYEVIAEFSHRMAGTLSIEEVLPRMAEAAARGVGAASSRVRLFLADGSERASVWPDRPERAVYDLTLPVGDRGQAIGEVAVAHRPGEQVTPVEEKLLADLAAQSKLVLHNVRLTVELQSRLGEISGQAAALRASRQRLVTAQDTERRSLEKTLHDGVQRELGEIRGALVLAERQLAADPDSAGRLLDSLTGRVTATLDELRDLARGLFPPLLADQGLVPALQAHVRKSGIDAVVEADNGISQVRFEQQVEATAYFCCVEALHREARGTGRPPATVRLQQSDGFVQFSVTVDDGRVELPPQERWQAMRDRVEALGGSLLVQGDQLSRSLLIGRVPASGASAAPPLEPVG